MSDGPARALVLDERSASRDDSFFERFSSDEVKACSTHRASVAEADDVLESDRDPIAFMPPLGVKLSLLAVTLALFAFNRCANDPRSETAFSGGVFGF